MLTDHYSLYTQSQTLSRTLGSELKQPIVILSKQPQWLRMVWKLKLAKFWGQKTIKFNRKRNFKRTKIVLNWKAREDFDGWFLLESLEIQDLKFYYEVLTMKVPAKRFQLASSKSAPANKTFLLRTSCIQKLPRTNSIALTGLAERSSLNFKVPKITWTHVSILKHSPNRSLLFKNLKATRVWNSDGSLHTCESKKVISKKVKFLINFW